MARTCKLYYMNLHFIINVFWLIFICGRNCISLMTVVVVNMCGIEYYVRPSCLFMRDINGWHEANTIVDDEIPEYSS